MNLRCEKVRKTLSSTMEIETFAIQQKTKIRKKHKRQIKV